MRSQRRSNVPDISRVMAFLAPLSTRAGATRGADRPRGCQLWLFSRPGAPWSVGSSEIMLPDGCDVTAFWAELDDTLAQLIETPGAPGPATQTRGRLRRMLPGRRGARATSDTKEGALITTLLDQAWTDLAQAGPAEADLDESEPEQEGRGISVEDSVLTAERAIWHPAPPPLRDDVGRSVNEYEMDVYDAFPRLAVASQLLQRDAVARGLDTRRMRPKDFSAADAAGHRMVFTLSLDEASSPVSGYLTGNKQLTRRLLESSGAPVPDGRAFPLTQVEDAVQYAGSIGWPVVVKPLAGKSGIGVFTDISDAEQLRWAVTNLRKVAADARRFIVESHMEGADYRIYVAHGEVLSVVLRRPAHITGDGVRSVSELVLEKNLARRRNPHTRSRLITPDEVASTLLHRQGLGWDHIPETGAVVALASAANISRGGDSTEVLDETHPSIIDAALQAAHAIPGLEQAGVDFLLTDHRVPLQDQHGGICEINTTPALMANGAPVFGQRQDLAARVLELAAQANGLTLRDRVEHVNLQIDADGVQDPAGLAEWVEHHAHHIGVTLTEVGIDDSSLSFHVQGHVRPVIGLVTSVTAGPAAQRPDSVHTRHLTAAEPATSGAQR